MRVALGRLVVFAVGLSDAGGVFGLLVGLDTSMLIGLILGGPLDLGPLALGKRRSGGAGRDGSQRT
jgi:hypothetical protein